MAKYKVYCIYEAGGQMVDEVIATCITKACKELIKSLPGERKYKLLSSTMAEVRKTDNHSVCGDYVVMER